MQVSRFIMSTSILLTSCNDDSKLRELENRIGIVEEQIHDVRKDVIGQKIDSEYDGYTFLRPGSQGFSTLNLEIGAVTIALTDVQEYANGSKISLTFGNPHMAQISEVKFDIDYGPLDGSGRFIADQKKTKAISIVEPLRRATWTKTTIVLDGVMPAQLGEMKIYNATYKGIELYQFKDPIDGSKPPP